MARKGRVTNFTLNPRLLKYSSGKYFRGELDRLLRAIRSRKAQKVFVYIEMPLDPVKMIISPEPIETDGTLLDLIGVYTKDVTAAMLRDDLPYGCITAVK